MDLKVISFKKKLIEKAMIYAHIARHSHFSYEISRNKVSLPEGKLR